MWMQEQSAMPTPADIKKICQTRIFVCRDIKHESPNERKKEPEYVRDVEAVRKLVEECKKNLSMPRHA